LHMKKTKEREHRRRRKCTHQNTKNPRHKTHSLTHSFTASQRSTQFNNNNNLTPQATEDQF
jgi:hypothetical protein